MSVPNMRGIKFLVLSFGFLFLALCCAPGLCVAQTVSSTGLINSPQLYDGKEVIYSGEAIGDIMVRGKYAWVNVHDGQNAIGIWLPRELTRAILFKGSYKTIGDWVEITGVFHQVCKEHTGEFDIHATGIKRIHDGYFVSRIFNRARLNKAVILLVVLWCVWILRRLIKT